MTQTLTLAADARAPAGTPRRSGPVLVAVTGLDGAHLLRAAMRLATHRDAALHVVAVVEPLPLYAPGTDTVVFVPPGADEESRALLLDRVRAQTRDALGADATAVLDVRVGDPARCITDAARACGAALIVVGIGRHRPIDRLLGGETAVRIVRQADRPVLAVARGADATPSRVVIATDFSPSSARAAELVLPFVADGATLTFVHAWQRAALTSPWIAATEDAYARSVPSALARLARAIDAPSGLSLHTVALEGAPVEQVLSFARGNAADLIVVGRSNRSWIDRLFLGSVATGVLRGATCSVFVTPDPGIAEKDRLNRLVAGVSEGVHPSEWIAQLDGFSRRNLGRRVTIEEDDPALGAQVLVHGLPLRGATYDPHDRRVELMLGGSGGAERRLTHGIGDVHALTILAAEHGHDTTLSIRHGSGQTLLTFDDVVPPAPQ